VIPAKYDFPTLYEGDTHDGLSITVTTTTGSTTTPVDLTNVTIAMQVRDRDDLTVLALDLAVGTGITKTNPTDGVFTIDPFTVPTAGTYVYDIEFTYASGAVKTYMGGRLTSVADVTG
jgi:archaellin